MFRVNNQVNNILTGGQNRHLIRLYLAGGQEHEGHFLSSQHDLTVPQFQTAGRCHFLKGRYNEITFSTIELVGFLPSGASVIH